MFGDEASFWLDGTLHRTWARIGEQPRVATFGMRKTAHVFGAVSLARRPRFAHQFAERFNASTFLVFLKHLVAGRRRKIFLIIDKGPATTSTPPARTDSRTTVIMRTAYDNSDRAG